MADKARIPPSKKLERRGSPKAVRIPKTEELINIFSYLLTFSKNCEIDIEQASGESPRMDYEIVREIFSRAVSTLRKRDIK